MNHAEGRPWSGRRRVAGVLLALGLLLVVASLANTFRIAFTSVSGTGMGALVGAVVGLSMTALAALLLGIGSWLAVAARRGERDVLVRICAGSLALWGVSWLALFWPGGLAPDGSVMWGFVVVVGLAAVGGGVTLYLRQWRGALRS